MKNLNLIIIICLNLNIFLTGCAGTTYNNNYQNEKKCFDSYHGTSSYDDLYNEAWVARNDLNIKKVGKYFNIKKVEEITREKLLSDFCNIEKIKNLKEYECYCEPMKLEDINILKNSDYNNELNYIENYYSEIYESSSLPLPLVNVKSICGCITKDLNLEDCEFCPIWVTECRVQFHMNVCHDPLNFYKFKFKDFKDYNLSELK